MDETALRMSKKRARTDVLARLRALSNAEHEERSLRVAERVLLLDAWRRAELVLVFVSMECEIRTERIISAAVDAGKTVGVPRMHGRAIRFHAIAGTAGPWDHHPYGVKEPPETSPLLLQGANERPRVLVVTPGCAFDRRGGRIGYGRGYYDAFLTGEKRRRNDADSLTAVGIGYDEQILEEVPMGPRDVRLDGVVTPSGVIYPPDGRL